MRRWIALLLLAGCVRGAGSRCETVCRREADCADKLELPDGDFSSCLEACNELERDQVTARAVEAHVACVAAAESCAAVMDCR